MFELINFLKKKTRFRVFCFVFLCAIIKKCEGIVLKKMEVFFMETDLFYHIKRINGRYEKNDCNGNVEMGEDKNYTCFVGEIPILFSAPHSV